MARDLAPDQLARFYRLMSARMLDFDCGALCAPRNHGVPYCCDGEQVIPLVYKSELRWLAARGDQWRRMPSTEEPARTILDGAAPYNLCAMCTGPARCTRSLRALACRAYPLEPHLDYRGAVEGLVFLHDDADRCPLVAMPRSTFRPAYLRNALVFWQELVDALPEERELFILESGQREHQAYCADRTFRLLR
jgi:hypothetical protein